jgi:hypothetical protein
MIASFRDDVQRRLPANEIAERFPLHVLHGDEWLAVVLADVEDRDDVDVPQPAGGSRFARESLADFGVVEALAKQLDGDQAIDRRIAGEIERPHPPLTDAVQNLVATDRGHRMPNSIDPQDVLVEKVERSRAVPCTRLRRIRARRFTRGANLRSRRRRFPRCDPAR